MDLFFSLIQNLLPAVCLSLLCIFSVIGKRNAPGIAFMFLLAIATITFLCDSAYLIGGASQSLQIVSISCGIVLVPLMWMSLETTRDMTKGFSIAMMIGIVTPILIFVGCIIVVFMTPVLGTDSYNPSSSGRIVRSIIMIFLVVEFILAILYLAPYASKQKGLARPISIVFALITIFAVARIIPIHERWVWVIANIITTGLIIAEATLILKLDLRIARDITKAAELAKKNNVSIGVDIIPADDSKKPVSDDLTAEDIETAQAEQDAQAAEDAKAQAEEIVAQTITPLSADAENSLKAKFENYVIAGQKFLTPGLTMGDVAKDLQTNRTYISQLVNQTYGMTFPEFLNSLRIDYAEQYILHNRNASQHEIAHACGFPSASSFNVTFKKITGVTPRIWLVTYADKA